MENKINHYPVLHKEILNYISQSKGEIIVDATVGGGGHSYEILKNLPDKKLVGLDKDSYAIERAKERLKEFKGRFTLVKTPFKNLDKVLDDLGIEKAGGFIFDLGVSHFQLKTERGFSFQREEFLDMRMDKESDLTAYDVVNSYPEYKLAEIIQKYGEERFAKRIAKNIVDYRKKKKIETTKELENIVFHSYSRKLRYGRIHPATRTFQAIRIEVNNELEEIKEALNKAIKRLDKGGIIAVISFHSLEDRIAKNIYKEHKSLKNLEILTKKPIIPTNKEMEENPPSRSAKLRVAKRV
jgi:16S rRNA (cytosine1402-N4)-methyltransferase